MNIIEKLDGIKIKSEWPEEIKKLRGNRYV